ncbi:MAG: M14 family metallopeptidase [Rhodothermales bacterium]
MLRESISLGLLLLLSGPLVAQPIDFSYLETRAEATDYSETTRYDEVVAFSEIVAKGSDRLFKATFGYTSEGRALPLVVFGDVDDATPGAVLASGKTRVFVQANIHAGEVCGKEAMLMLLRSLAAGQHAEWADSLVLLIAPIYNADGNERINLRNRPRQNGPMGGMGQRPNAQGYDLNRDHMKLDSPEARSLVRLFTRYDPHVVVDLHTTNGTYHGYHLTYSPPLHPNTPDGIDTYLRQVWLPAVTQRIKEEYGWDYYYYGNVPRRGEPGWYTFDHRPRFNNNYTGLRNRFAILSEAYSYATFEERVLASLYFVEEILTFAHVHAGEIREITRRADAEPIIGRDLAVRARHKQSEEPVDILLGAVEAVKHPFTGATVLQRLDVQKTRSMYEYGRFEPTEVASVPRAYLIPEDQSAVLDRLEAHGIHFRRLRADSTIRVERFRVDSTQVAGREYQGHHARTWFGTYEQADLTIPSGMILVSTDQPLGRLLFYLLEPRSDDGLASWGLVEPAGDTQDYYPILRLSAEP